MRITSISVENFLGIRSAQVNIARPVTLFAGANYAGKSSLKEAVRMALVGEAVRVSLKKEYPALISDGAKEGFAEVLFDDRRAFIMLPSGKGTPPAEYTPPKALPYVLDAQRFATLEVNDRRTFLFGLMGMKITPEAVSQRLAAKGADAKKVEQVIPLLRSGFPEACKAAKDKGTEAKGAWRAVTGETYGSVKGGTWKADKPAVDKKAHDQAVESLRAHDDQIAAANQTLGGLRADKKRHDDQQANVDGLREKVARLDRAKKKLTTDEVELADWIAKVTAAESAQSSREVLKCPCCEALLVHEGGALVQVEAEAVAASQEADKLPEYQRSRDLMNKAVANDKRDIADIEAAAAELKAITEASPAPKQSEIDDAAAVLADLTAKRATVASKLEQLAAATRAAAEADQRTAKAAGHHADVLAWEKIADALAPDGIPGEMLAEALKPINDRLHQSALDSEWTEARINDDMSIVVGIESNKSGRPYALLSESEQWRVDAMLAEAISFQSGLKLLMLDRFDVLDAKGRTDLLAWLQVLADGGEIETALLFGTLKSLPSDLPATVAAEWINHGRVGQLKEAA